MGLCPTLKPIEVNLEVLTKWSKLPNLSPNWRLESD